MAYPSKAAGFGNNSTARNVFAITFSQPLSAAPQFEAYDGGTFPAVGSGTTVTGKAFVGTAGNSSKPMVSLVDTSAAAPTSNWMPAAAVAGSNNPNRLKAQTNYVVSSMTSAGGTGVGAYGTGFSAGAGNLGNGTGAIGGAGNPTGVLRWNEVLEIPSDVVPTDNLTYDLLVRYQYTGSAPTVAWYWNDGGSENTPTWSAFTVGSQGLRHCNSGTVAGTYKLDIPSTGTALSLEGWITA